MPKAKKNEKYAKMDAIKGHKIEETREEDLENPKTEIVEKIIYKKQRVHGFFRTLTILVLLVI